MKFTSVLLAGSLAANAGLLALFAAGGFRIHALSPAISDTTSSAAARSDRATDSSNNIGSSAWSSLASENPADLRDRLRAEGFPPATIRALVADQIRLQFASKRAALNARASQRPFWEPMTPDPKTAAALAQLTKEQNQALKDVLGSEALLNNTQATTLRQQFPTWSDEKIAAVLQAQQTLNQKNQETLESGLISSADLTSLRNQQHEEIAKLLTPQELEDYDLRTSTTANSLRSRLANFNPTEQEFRTLYQLQKAFDDQYQVLSLSALGPDQQSQTLRQRSEAQTQLTNQIKAALGDQRYAEYQRSSDSYYQETARLVARLELPSETANQVYAVQQDLQQRLRTVQTDRSLSFEERNTQLSALATEAQTKISATLGPRGFEAYKQYGGSWMNQLQPRPPPTARPVIGAGGRGSL
jgi:hypothetical protein